MIRVAIAASSPMVRIGLRSLIERAGIEIVGVVSEVTALGAYPADVAVVSLERQDEEPPPELVALAAMPLVILLDDPQPAWVAEALRAGVRAVLPADLNAEELGAAIQAAAAGLVVLHPQEAQPLFASAAMPEPRLTIESLTPRETEVLRMLSRGLSNKEIAARLDISDHTVKFHVASVMSKFGAGTRTEAVTIGLRQGLILL